MEETKKDIAMENEKGSEKVFDPRMQQPGSIRMLVPTKVETVLTVPQLWNGLFSALFGTPHDINAQTGVDISDLYLAQFMNDEGVDLKVCYAKDGKEVVYDDRGKLWKRMLQIGNEIFPNAQMDISIHAPEEKLEGTECSKEEDTSSKKQQD